jgi:hypothetical protein
MLFLRKVGERVEHFLSAEWFLVGSANGGGVILFRALWTMAWIYGIGLVLRNFLDPSRSWQFSSIEFRRQLLESGQWIAGIFTGVYTALYARFASQWQYLAGVYNQIKAAESRKDHDPEKVADWKYGFIEDAVEVHLALKPMFAGTIREWLKEDLVRQRFDQEVADGPRTLSALSDRIDTALSGHSR